MNDSLGDRMKHSYENRTRYLLPRRSYVIVRVDGRAFHTYTRGCERPYDQGLMDDMDVAAIALCQNMSGARLALVQSDGISVLLTDFETTQTEAWFDNNLLKICSLSSSIATGAFNLARIKRALAQRFGESAGLLDSAGIHSELEKTPAQFDSRVFTIPDYIEVFNYFVWRQQDATRNAISMAAQARFPHAQLVGVDVNRMQEMLFQECGINFNDYPAGFKRGRVVERVGAERETTFLDTRDNQEKSVATVRYSWKSVEPPIFTQNREWLLARIPVHGAKDTV